MKLLEEVQHDPVTSIVEVPQDSTGQFWSPICHSETQNYKVVPLKFAYTPPYKSLQIEQKHC